MSQRDALARASGTVPIDRLAPQRSRRVCAVAVIVVTGRVVAVNAGVQKDHLSMVRAGCAHHGTPVSETRMIQVQAAVGRGQDNAASVEPQGPQRHAVLRSRLEQPCPPVVPGFCGQHRLDPLHSRPVLLARMKGRGEDLRAAQHRIHVRRAADGSQVLHSGMRKTRFEDKPDLLSRVEGRHVKRGGIMQLEPLWRGRPTVVPDDGFRPRGQPEEVPTVACEARPIRLGPHALVDLQHSEAGFVRWRRHWPKPRSEQQNQHEGGAHAPST